MLISLDGVWIERVGEWVPWFLDVTVKTTLLLALVFAANKLLKRTGARTRHVLWSAALLGILLVPVLSLVVPAWHVASIPTLWEPTTSQLTATLLDTPVVGQLEALDPSGPVQSLDESAHPGSRALEPARPVASSTETLGSRIARIPWTVWVSVIWFAGAALVLGSFLLGLARARGIARSSTSLDRGHWLAMIAETSERVALARPIRLRMHDVSVPATWGWLHPVVVMPNDADSWPRERQRVVLLHELAHVKRNDWLVYAAARLTCAVYWFNPLVWTAVKQLCIEREKACDDHVIRLGTKPSEYANHLLEIARAATSRALLAAALTMARPSQLEGRLMSILTNTNRPRSRRAWVLTVLVAGLIVPLAAIEPAGESPRAAIPAVLESAVELHDPGDETSSGSEPSAGAGYARAAQGAPSQSTSRARDAYSRASAYTSDRSDSRFKGTWIHTEDDDGKRTQYRIGHLNGVFIFEEYIEDVGLHIRVDGEVKFNDAGDAIVDMDRDAVVLLEADEARAKARLEITNGRDGELQYAWEVDGKQAAYDDDAQEWTRAALAICSRRIQIGMLYGERHTLHAEINSIHGESNSLQGEINSIYGERNLLEGDINSLYGEMNSLQGDINSLYGDHNSLEGDINGIYGERNALQGEINSLYARQNALEATIRELENEKTILKQERRHLESEYKSSDKKTDRSYKKTMERIEKALVKIDDAISDTKEQIDESNARVRDIERQIDDLKIVERVEVLKEQIEELNVEEKARRLAEAMEAIDVETRARDIRDQIAALHVEELVRELEARIEELNVEKRVKKLEREIDELNVDERVEAIEKELESKYKQLKKRTAKLRR
jgi:beta-lactamase regulating signal transducer with metallopeptidase domain/peptidoglycan hydrolase CwlO-like protein